MRAARTLLERLGALHADGHVTSLGQQLAHMPLHPRQARVLADAEARGVAEDGAVVAALLGSAISASSSGPISGAARPPAVETPRPSRPM